MRVVARGEWLYMRGLAQCKDHGSWDCWKRECQPINKSDGTRKYYVTTITVLIQSRNSN